ncbi:NACHT domain-containing protein [Streptomyces sp. NPDC004111]|uniref:NACHT domain-containing protein n=1 Tax=Streptomyces sp. NPDC004111 TaxID=3364690 RepID=UPI00368C5784
MRGRRLLSYRDAVAILGGDSEALAAADQVVGGALNLATGGASDTVLGLVGAQGRLLRAGRDALGGLRGRLGTAERAARTEKIAAAHTVLVVVAFFESLAEAELPFDVADLEVTRSEQIALTGGDAEASGLLRLLLSVEVPLPSPAEPYETMLDRLCAWYIRPSLRLLQYLQGLSVWDGLDTGARSATEAVLRDLDRRAAARYDELYAQLALEIPEFGYWSGQVEHQATRNEVRRALAGVEAALLGLSAALPLGHAAAALTAAYQAALDRPILSGGKTPSGITLPTLTEGYVDPDFRVARVAGESSGPAGEDWWDGTYVRSDLTEFFAAALTSLGSTTAPLLVLGQPGAGKSVLTKILAARLPETGYLPVRVVLREIRAEDEVQDQIEHAVRLATGERVSWPELVRSAAGAVPVLLFDGFDELLQATGVSQTDYLVRVARFQQREADQGRPVYAVVTSRTAVADRARCPEGTVALRLEPFREPQIERWLDVWNELNAPHFTAHGLRPLSGAVAGRHVELASQPLLLLMLALYDANGNALQQDSGSGEPLGAADLYEELLTSFAVREIGKSGDNLDARQLAEHTERELQRLSLIAFGILNRRRQWITADELDQDLVALLGRPDLRGADFRAPLGQAEIALGRFFFVQRAQALQDDQQLITYEFLHATFGEYLAARLAVQVLAGLLAQRPALALGRVSVDDDLLYALLSYNLLATRQMLRFVDARLAKLPETDRQRLGDLLVSVMDDARERGAHQYSDYRPIRRATAARHGKYEANLVLMAVLLRGSVTASRLFPEAEDPAGIWWHRTQLWRSALTEQEWTEFALALKVRRRWEGERRELTVERWTGDEYVAEDIDPYWLFRHPPGSETYERDSSWWRSYWQEIQHKMEVAGGTNDSVVRHALDPMFRHIGASVAAFHGGPDGGTATSIAHDLMELWLRSSLGGSDAELAEHYLRCSHVLEHARFFNEQFGHRAAALVVAQLGADAHRLPVDVVAKVLVEALPAIPAELAERCARIAVDRLDRVETNGQEALVEGVQSLVRALVRTLTMLSGAQRPTAEVNQWMAETSTGPALRFLEQDELFTATFRSRVYGAGQD